jgi:outer membrane receptor protein involved in Fe transport
MKRLTMLAGAATSAWVFIGLTGAEAQTAAPQVEEVVVTGSRIPRVQIEGPAPVTVINADQISANGFASVPDVLRAITQNAGETQSQQSFSGASFTPGAQQVDLRGLGPNHTLVLVNGRRIADFPLPFQGRSNFTDISNIPLGMIDRIEILSGSASAVYGSDAISGVVNFVLKKKVDGTTIDYRFGQPEDGGGSSHRLTVTSGFDKDRFSAVFAAEFLDQEPLWAYDRDIQDSVQDAPNRPVARRAYLRINPRNNTYVDPGAATCAAISDQDMGSIHYAQRKHYGGFGGAPGFFCGSDTAIGYGTILSQRRGVNTYGSLNYELNDHTNLFTDILVGYSKVALFPDVLDWQYQDANGSEDGVFYNSRSGLDSWYRQFSPEEMGGLKTGMIRTNETAISVTPGVKGSFNAGDWFAGGDWNYELSFNHSEYQANVSWPEVVNQAATDLFLGPQIGFNKNYGYPIFNADPARLYTPLTQAEYDSITSRAVYHPRSQNDQAQLTLNKADLFTLPGGPVGFAGVVEAGKQSYDLQPDPLALTNYYYGLRDSDGKGSRTHWGAGYEFRAPLFPTLELSTAGRYDQFKYAESTTGKFTYDAGVEWRPIKSVLLRAAYGTGFRAPDLHYVYSGEGNTHPSGTDYYTCRTQQPGRDIGDCSYADEGIVATRIGNPALKPETSKSLNYGVVWQPFRGFDLSVDYFRVQLNNGVLDLNIDSVLRQEADCRIGQTVSGSAVDITSPTCQDVIARVIRNSATSAVNPNGLVGVKINPINVATERTSGVDVAAHYRLGAGDLGVFNFALGYTYVHDHTSQQYPGDPTVDQLAYDSDFDIPRSKGNASVTWSIDKWTTTLHGQRLDRLPNYAETGYIKATYLFNASVQYQISDRAKVSLTVDNLFDTKPVRDPTYTAYPYYDISWFDAVGRTFFLEVVYKFGGGPL